MIKIFAFLFLLLPEMVMGWREMVEWGISRLVDQGTGEAEMGEDEMGNGSIVQRFNG